MDGHRHLTYDTDIVLTAGFGGRSYGVQSIMNLTISFTTGHDMDAKPVFLRAIVCKNVTIDLIIGLPSIKYFDLLSMLTSHISNTSYCEICEVLRSVPPIISPVAHLLINSQRFQLSCNRHQYNSVSTSEPTTSASTPTPRTTAHSKLSYRHGHIILSH